MQVRDITPNFHVTGQLRPADISKAAEAGYCAVICMRPDGEGWGQPKFSEIEAAGKASNIAVHYIPVGGPAVPMEQARKLRALLNETEGPVLAFCASGQRCAGLYQMAQQFGG
ncbi:TIGR01244 family sulfur transferase [Rhizobium sp. RU36D]|uniref:TIGR01244 family sulfur transferase n=1 Tax=Rhizobium sp. RU36D TaxID=1907415 RepID=UPI0009D90264|nr:TIGR01244 family sulfur transferase [Rhizobium sp. RU36D]SMC87562.1 TIGR01244 family protein [Rhizobium sp. RU36D]